MGRITICIVTNTTCISAFQADTILHFVCDIYQQSWAQELRGGKPKCSELVNNLWLQIPQLADS